MTGRWGTGRPFAGPSYEQGAFIRSLLPEAAALGIRVLPYHVFGEYRWERPHPDCMVVHLAGEYRGRLRNVTLARSLVPAPSSILWRCGTGWLVLLLGLWFWCCWASSGKKEKEA